MTTEVYTSKPFDQINHDQYDKPAKEITIEFLKQHNFINIEENVNENNINGWWDIKAFGFKNNQLLEYRFDCEIKTFWKNIDFLENDIQIPYRKITKDASSIKPTHHIVINKNSNGLCVITREVVENAPTRIIKPWNRDKEEKFLYISVKDALFYKKIDKKWEANF